MAKMSTLMKWVLRIALFPLLIPVPFIVLYAIVIQKVFELADEKWDFM